LGSTDCVPEFRASPWLIARLQRPRLMWRDIRYPMRRAVLAGGPALASLYVIHALRRRRCVGDRSAKRDAWVVLRCAAKSKEARTEAGGYRSPQGKVKSASLRVTFDGVIGTRRGWFSTVDEADYNHYRSEGDSRFFPPGTRDRAVSLVSSSVYDELRRALPGVRVRAGDLGENLLVEGPALDAGVDWTVGCRLGVGDEVVLELTEANKPCSRLAHLSWSGAAKHIVGEDKWWESPSLPLGLHRPGGRGWLAKVITEGVVKPNDRVVKL